MGSWFKYEFGFVNVDSENVYLTSTGNWSDTVSLSEKGNIKGYRKTKLQVILVGASFFCVYVGFSFFLKGRTSLYIAVAVLAIVYALYRYLKRELGPQYKIPISKLRSVEVDTKKAVLGFLDVNNQLVYQTLTQINEKGIQFLSGLVKP